MAAILSLRRQTSDRLELQRRLVTFRFANRDPDKTLENSLEGLERDLLRPAFVHEGMLREEESNVAMLLKLLIRETNSKMQYVHTHYNPAKHPVITLSTWRRVVRMWISVAISTVESDAARASASSLGINQTVVRTCQRCLCSCETDL
jgi:hypothetical protein